MSLEQRFVLKCPSCSSCEGFEQNFRFTWAMNGGIYQEPRGWKCCECRADVDQRAMSQNALLTKNKAELIATQKEIEEEQAQNTQASQKNASTQGDNIQDQENVQGQADPVGHSSRKGH